MSDLEKVLDTLDRGERRRLGNELANQGERHVRLGNVNMAEAYRQLLAEVEASAARESRTLVALEGSMHPGAWLDGPDAA